MKLSNAVRCAGRTNPCKHTSEPQLPKTLTSYRNSNILLGSRPLPPISPLRAVSRQLGNCAPHSRVQGGGRAQLLIAGRARCERRESSANHSTRWHNSNARRENWSPCISIARRHNFGRSGQGLLVAEASPVVSRLFRGGALVPPLDAPHPQEDAFMQEAGVSLPELVRHASFETRVSPEVHPPDSAVSGCCGSGCRGGRSAGAASVIPTRPIALLIYIYDRHQLDRTC